MAKLGEASGPIIADPIIGCVERWHQHVRGEFAPGLDALLHVDCVFESPIVFSPQRGKAITATYLTAALHTLAGGGGPDSKFRYRVELYEGHHAMLEFETEMDGVYVNGVDMITCDEEGLIIGFKVMIRPLQAVNLVHAQMKAMLELMSGGTSA